MRLSDVGITKRILIAVCLPVLLVLGLSYERIGRSAEAYRAADRLVDVTDYVSALGEAVHKLQVERGESAALLGSNAADSRGHLSTIRLEFDQLASAVAAKGEKASVGRATDFGEKLLALAQFRQRIDQSAVTPEESTTFYSGLVAQLLQIPRDLVAQGKNSSLSGELAAYNLFSQAKELAGQERAIGNAAISSGKIDAEKLLKLSRLYGAQATLLQEFEEAHPSLGPDLKAVGPDAQPRLASMRSEIFRAGANIDFTGWKVSDWYGAASERINRLREVEKKVLSSLRDDAVALAGQEMRALVTVGTVLAVALIAAIALSISIGLGVVRPLQQLTKVVEKLARGEADETSVSVDSKDEVGAMALAVRHAVEAAKQRAAQEREEDLQRAAQRQAEADTLEQERAARSRSLEMALSELDQGLRELASGNLRHRIVNELASGLDPLRLSYNLSVETLESLVSLAGANAHSINVACGELRGAADDLSRRTAGQAAALEEAAAALEEVATAVKMSASGADEAKRSVAIANADTSEATKIVADTVAAMQDIARSSNQIGQIIGVIDDIAFQTNLLALNAGVEAARAGEAGKGFAVVAQEVRELAQRSAAAAREIKDLVALASKDVSGGVALVGRTGEALVGIERHVQIINQQVLGIVQSSMEQSIALAEITSTVGQLDQITQQNASMVEQTNAATQSLAGETEKLREQLGTFQTGDAHQEPFRDYLAA